MKKLLSIILTILMVVTMIPMAVMPAGATGAQAQVNDNFKVEITRLVYTDSSGKTYDYTDTFNSWALYDLALTNVSDGKCKLQYTAALLGGNGGTGWDNDSVTLEGVSCDSAYTMSFEKFKINSTEEWKYTIQISKTVGHAYGDLSYIDDEKHGRICAINTAHTIDDEHSYNNGYCDYCDAYQSAELNENGYYEIGNAGQLFWYANYINTVDRTANAVLTADIDLENRPWTPIGSTGENSNNFRGIFDGQNHTIEGLYVEGDRAGLGFFGEVRTGTVKNFTIYGEVVVNTEVDYIGGVIGSVCGVNGENDLERNGAIIQNIKSYVNLTAKAHGIGKIGGFVGYANHQSLIENCSWYGTFDAGKYRVDNGAGGFIGRIQENSSEVTIRNCGAYGTIKTNYAGDYNNTATIYMGGFLSFTNTNAKTTLENCLFAGKFERGANLTDEAFLGAFGTLRSVNAIKNCYYLGYDGLEAVHSDSNLKPGSDNIEIIKVTEEQLKSGEVAYKLQEANEIWGQSIGTDAYPVLGGEDVYYGYVSCDDEAMVYTNDSTVSDTKPDHAWDEGSLTRPTKTQDGYYTYTCSACGETKTEPVLRAANYDDYTKALEDLRAYLDSDMLTDENKGYISEWLAMYDSDEAYSFIAGEEATVQEYIDATAYYASEIEAAIEDCLAGNHSGNGDYCEICGAELHVCDFTGEWKYNADKHWKECSCGLTSEEGTHTGGTATCTTQAVCESCGASYGELDPDNHDASTMDENGICGCGESFAAEVDGVLHATLDQALAAWVDGTTLTLLADVTDLTDYIQTTAKGLILDLNGHKIECSDTLCTIWIDGDSGSELTIRDGKGDGYIQGRVYAVTGGSKLRLESGTVETVTANGDFIMTGGQIICEDSQGLFVNSEVDVVISGGEIYGSTYGISISSGNVIISGDTKITGAGRYAILTFDCSVVISGTPTISGGTSEFYLGSKIALNTQPANDEVWRVKIDTEEITDGVFAVPGESVTLDASKFASAMDGYAVKQNAKGELLLCNHTEQTAASNRDGTHNTTCNCGEATFDTNVACSGGVATDTHQAYCEYCNAPYGEVNPDVHCDIFAVNMTAEQLQSDLLELLNAGNTDIFIVLAAKADEEMFTAINTAFCSSTAAAGSVNLTIAGAQTVSNITVLTPDGEKIPLALKTLTLPGATALDMNAITYVSNLEAIYLPNVTSIDVWGLDGLDALNTLVLSAEGAITFREFNAIDLPFANIDLTLHCNKKYDVTDGTIWQGKTWKSISFAHSWTDGICAACGEVCPHEKYTDGICDNCDYECPHSWDEGVLTRPVYDAVLGSKDGYYTYTCAACGEEKTETVKSADYSAYEAVSEEINALLQSDDLTSEAKQAIYSAANECGLPSNDLTESEQNIVDSLVAELEKIIADADEKIASGEYVKIDGMKEYNKIADALDAELMENYSQEEIAALAEKAGDEINARFGEIIEKAEALTGTVAENKDALAEIESEMRALYGEIKNCLDGVHNGLVYEVTEEAKCEVNAIESATCTLCGETDEREVEGTALEHEPNEQMCKGYWCSRCRSFYGEGNPDIHLDGYSSTGKIKDGQCDGCNKQLAFIKSGETYEINSYAHVVEFAPVVDGRYILTVDGPEGTEIDVREVVDGVNKGINCEVISDLVYVVDCTVGKIYRFEASNYYGYNISSMTLECETHKGTVQTCYGYICDACGEYFGEVPGHDIIIDEAVPPTCTQTGLTEGQHCSRCDDMTIIQEKVPATNHKDTLVKVDAKAATCTEAGWEAYEYCTACDYTTYEEIPALKHSFTKYEVAEEAECGKTGKEVAYCDHGCGATDENEIPALTHKDDDGDHLCDYGCGTQISDGAEGETGSPADDCDHLCHKDGILGFLWKIINFFYRLFNIQQYCDCGVIHYDAPVFG